MRAKIYELNNQPREVTRKLRAVGLISFEKYAVEAISLSMRKFAPCGISIEKVAHDH